MATNPYGLHDDYLDEDKLLNDEQDLEQIFKSIPGIVDDDNDLPLEKILEDEY